MTRELALMLLPWLVVLYGVSAALAGYWLGEKMTYASCRLYAEDTFASATFRNFLRGVFHFGL